MQSLSQPMHTVLSHRCIVNWHWKWIFVVIRSINFFFSIQIRTDTFPNPITLPHEFKNGLCKWMAVAVAGVEHQMAICKRRTNHECYEFRTSSVRTRALTFDDLLVDRRMRYVFMGRCHASTFENHSILIGNLAFMVETVLVAVIIFITTLNIYI